MGYFVRFVQWQNYVHYVFLVLALFFVKYIPWTVQINARIDVGQWWYNIVMFFWYVLCAFVIDSLIHGVFYVLPEPYRWRD